MIGTSFRTASLALILLSFGAATVDAQAVSTAAPVGASASAAAEDPPPPEPRTSPTRKGRTPAPAPPNRGTVGAPSTPPKGPLGPGDIRQPPIFDTWKERPNGLLDLPCDFPGRGGMTIYQCSSSDAGVINVALDLAAYYVWRVRQVLDKVAKAETKDAKVKIWKTYFEGYQTGGQSLQNWFGDYSDGRFKGIAWAYQDIWDKYLGPGFKQKQVSCACYSNAMSAHAFNPKGIEVCPKFFNKSKEDQARVFVHEFLHNTWVDGWLVQDIHVACTIDDGDDGAEKCYSAEECIMLAQHHPDKANNNNQNYALYARRLAERYQSGTCTNEALCSPRNNGASGCQPVVHHAPTYPDCDDPTDPANFGTLGCPCADLDLFKSEDAAGVNGFPDGEGSFLKNKKPAGQFCDGSDLVCGKLVKDGIEYPICRSCETQAEIGCPCSSQNDCGDGGNLSCWGAQDTGWDPVGTGTCLPTTPSDELEWFCLDNCASISSDGENGDACVYRQLSGIEFNHGTCVNFATACGKDLNGKCEAEGRICREVNGKDTCVAECAVKADCSNNGFPDTYECDAEGDLHYNPGHCVPAGCGNSSSAHCNLFR